MMLKRLKKSCLKLRQSVDKADEPLLPKLDRFCWSNGVNNGFLPVSNRMAGNWVILLVVAWGKN
jgi:hypothetical protein